MKAVAKITSKGQITIPVEIRKALGVGTGDYLEFCDLGAGVSVIPKRQQNPFLEPPKRKYQMRRQANAVRAQRETRGYDEFDLALLDAE